jgi:hypothetical protein
MNTPAAGESGHLHLRASDADRDRVAEILRQATEDGRLTLEELNERLDQAYAAKTYGELVPITRDLVPQPEMAHRPGSAHVPAPVRPHLNPARFGGTPDTPAAIAIMSGFSRKGDWVVPRQFTAFTLMGGGEIDMRDARFSEPTVTIHVVTIMGGVEITVPEDATVRVTGIGVMGAFDDAVNGDGKPGGPTIVVDGVALMGGVEIKRRPPKTAKW